MKLHKRFILDIWKSAAYYDFQNTFKVPDTFYLHEKKIDWIFTGKSGKILRKKQENSTVNIVKDYFCNIEKNEQENELNNTAMASQLMASYDEGICYFHYLDLSGVCELLVDSFRKKDERDFEKGIDIEFTTDTSQQKTESNLNQNELSDKTAMIQRFIMNSSHEKNMIRIEWNLNGKFTAQKRISNYESFRKEDDYKSYLIFEDENMSVNRELNLNEKSELLVIAQHVVKAMELIHNERGKINKISLLLTEVNNAYYLLACISLQFVNDQSLPQPWRISYELKMRYPNQAIHMQNALADVQNCIKKIENTKKVLQCHCCKNFASKLQAITSTKLIQIRMRRGIGISQYEAKQLKKKDFSDICEVCYQIFLEIHKVSSHSSNQSNSITENSFMSKHSISIIHSHRSSSHREKRSKSNYELGGRQSNSSIQQQNDNSQNTSYNIQNYTSVNSREQNSRSNMLRDYSSNPIRETSNPNLKEYATNTTTTQGDQSTLNIREYSSNNIRDSSSQRSSNRMPPLSFRIADRVKANSSSRNNIYNTNQSTTINSKLSNRTLNQLNSDISNQQLCLDLPESKKSIQITNDISNPYDISESSKAIQHKDGMNSVSSKVTTFRTKENDFYNVNAHLNKLSQIQESPIKLKQNPSERKISSNQIFSEQNEKEIKQPQSETKTIKGKFGIKLALKNLKKDVKKQQEEIKNVIQESLTDCQQISLKLDSCPSENRRYSKTNIRKLTPKNSSEQPFDVYRVAVAPPHTQQSVSTIRASQELQQKSLPPRSKNSSHSNRTGMSNQSTTNQSFSSNPQANSSLESASLKVIQNKQNSLEPNQYLRDLLKQNENQSSTNPIQNRVEQRMYSQDTIFSQRFRKNSFEQEERTLQNSYDLNAAAAYGEPQKSIHHESQERLDTKQLNNNTISQEFLQNRDTFLDNLQSSTNNLQINMYRVRRSQSFKK